MSLWTPALLGLLLLAGVLADLDDGMDDVDRATRNAYLRFRSVSEAKVGSGGGGLPNVQAGVHVKGYVIRDRLAPWSGSDAAAEYQSRLASFHSDAAAPVARYASDGSVASVDVEQARGVGGANS